LSKQRAFIGQYSESRDSAHQRATHLADDPVNQAAEENASALDAAMSMNTPAKNFLRVV
jgi:hypothetical protein